MLVKFQKKIESNKDFINLGKIDKDDFRHLNENYSKIAVDNPIFKMALDSITKWQQKKIKKIESCRPMIQAYAQGLGVAEDDVYSSMLVPEIIASFNKWLPNLLGLVPGCSSLFTQDSTNNGIIHTRLLDYMAGAELIQTERALHISNKNQNDIFGFSFAGHPIASTSAINSNGLTMAIHYKHGSFFNIEGSSIFEICYELLLECSTIDEVKRRIKRYSSIAHWGIYLSDRTNTIASIDIRGNEINFESYRMKDYKFLYFNNQKMNIDNKTSVLQPYGHDFQCSMRRKTLKKNINIFNIDNKEEALKCLTYIESSQNKKSWSLAPLTVATAQAYSFNNKDLSSIFIKGDIPKFFSRKKVFSSNVFESIFDEKSSNEQSLNKFEIAYANLSKAQYSIDIKNFEKAYFHIQMAIAGFKGTSEEYIAKFYFYVLEYITNSDSEDLYYILKNFKRINSHLPIYLRDHCYLFQFRILKLLSEPYKFEDFNSKINTKNLKTILEKEHKLNNFSLKMLKKLIYLKIEISDIIYAY